MSGLDLRLQSLPVDRQETLSEAPGGPRRPLNALEGLGEFQIASGPTASPGGSCGRYLDHARGHKRSSQPNGIRIEVRNGAGCRANCATAARSTAQGVDAIRDSTSPEPESLPAPGIALTHSRLGSSQPYNSTASTSATNRPWSSARKAVTTLNTASLKPPTFRMSGRSGAWVVVYGCKSMQTSFGPVPVRPPPVGRRPQPLADAAGRTLATVAERLSNEATVLLVANERHAGASMVVSPGPPQPLLVRRPRPDLRHL